MGGRVEGVSLLYEVQELAPPQFGFLARVVLDAQSLSKAPPLTDWAYGTSREKAEAAALACLSPHLPYSEG